MSSISHRTEETKMLLEDPTFLQSTNLLPSEKEMLDRALKDFRENLGQMLTARNKVSQGLAKPRNQAILLTSQLDLSNNLMVDVYSTNVKRLKGEDPKKMQTPREQSTSEEIPIRSSGRSKSMESGCWSRIRQLLLPKPKLFQTIKYQPLREGPCLPSLAQVKPSQRPLSLTTKKGEKFSTTTP
ncbi:putative structural/accessory protein [Botrylloides leachii nidovirus]|uniref:Putative structural/accessory protein n=1 Tax=Botrylloides leachii nidovirus TaxID=2509395 RepID=A0A650BKV8_9NIDO|nr:putative structural/accessory protein [Botrylloides leachii nidovirus]QGQ56581.1 putative structural/accessory protein [Botrylloides leachii nidovirus]